MTASNPRTMFDDPIYHVLCVECRTALVADSIAKRERLPRSANCPVCGEARGDTWRPVTGPADALSEVVGEYDVVEVTLHEFGHTVLDGELATADQLVYCITCGAEYPYSNPDDASSCRDCGHDGVRLVDVQETSVAAD